MKKNKSAILAMILLVAVFSSCKQQPISITIDVDNPKAEIQPTMWGVFFEDINFAADGGIYAELVMNRSFEFDDPRMGWNVIRTSQDSSHFTIINRGDATDNPRFARVQLSEDSIGSAITNTGFRGMGVKQDNQYHFSVLAALTPESSVNMFIELLDQSGKVIGETTITPAGNEWNKYESTFTSKATDSKASLRIRFKGKGTIDLDMVSLFPADTWKNRSNGLRADMVQLLADMEPGFLRFPGGCIVEGRTLSVRYQWKKTVGDPATRKSIVNRWNTEFRHRPTPDYFQSFGLGFFEYFQLAEDIGATPLPILNCGMACEFNTAELVPLDKLEPYVQDALDLIEFANGSPESTWGSIRAQMGHPESFNLKFLGIGNEQWGAQYFERYAIFEKAINSAYPDIVLVSSTGPGSDDSLFVSATRQLQKYHPGIVDEHYYKNPQWFLDNTTRYDNYDRNTYKIFAGEYAAQSVETCSPDNKNNWECALSEAAYMTGLERNADVVWMCSYAPLFGHTEAWQWTPDLIWFDNLTSYGTPNYYVQKLFANHKGTHVLNMLDNEKPLTGQNGVYGSAAWDSVTNEVIIKLVNTGRTAQSLTTTLNTSKVPVSKAKMIVLKGKNLKALNSIDQPVNVAPVESELIISGKEITLKLQSQSMTVFRIGLK